MAVENYAMNCDNPGKVLVLAAHPDDEALACGGLLQRTAEALVVFAVDGAPPHYGFEKKFGSLQRYSELRFHEAERALGHIPQSSFRRLAKTDGAAFVDQHLFMTLPEAFANLLRIAREFSPDVIVSHAFEGGHIDHDACHVLAARAANILEVQFLEFPLYWHNEPSKDIFQQFRQNRAPEFALQLTPQELLVKERMLAEYRSQANLTAVFSYEIERFRPALDSPITSAAWHKYPFENRWRQLKAGLLLEKVAEFQQSVAATTA
jgi:N-acetylglucosamine malate deacetylase 2